MVNVDKGLSVSIDYLGILLSGVAENEVSPVFEELEMSWDLEVDVGWRGWQLSEQAHSLSLDALSHGFSSRCEHHLRFRASLR